MVLYLLLFIIHVVCLSFCFFLYFSLFFISNTKYFDMHTNSSWGPLFLWFVTF